MDIRKIATVVALTAGPLFLFSQPSFSTGRDTADYPYWFDMMQDPAVNFYATQSAFYKYFAGRDTTAKGTGFKIFKRWEYVNRPRIAPDGTRPAPDYVARIYNEYMRNQVAFRSLEGTWSIVGPVAYPANATGQPTGMGRVNAIAFHPTNASIIYVGAPAGGIWKTTDGGASWVSLSSDMPTLGVSAIVVHPTNPDIIYIGSGDRDSDDAPGMGVFKSTDGGATWAQMISGMVDGNITKVNALAMDPNNSNIMFAATSTGLYRTTNGATTWSRYYTGSVWKDVRFKPGSSSTVYAAYGGSFYRTTNGGSTWSPVTIPVSGARIVIGVTPANPDYVYLTQTQSTSPRIFNGLMRSTDSGATFTTMSTTPNIYDYACNGSGTSSQATYDLCIAVDRNNADVLYVGSINTWKSTDGGATWSIKTHWVGSAFAPGDPTANCAASVHADHHVLEWSPLTGALYLGHDGGISLTGDGGATWLEITSNLAIAQVYKIGQSSSNPGLSINGYQDNGSAVIAGGASTTVRGGDGMECLIDYSDNNYRYTTGPNGSFSRSSGGGYGSIKNNITESGAWVTPITLHRSDPNTMFAGYKNVWRTTNVKASSTSSVSWSAISTGESDNCIASEQSPANLDILYVARAGSLKRSDNANAGSVAWTTCNLPGADAPTDVKAHPTNANIVYMTAGSGVFKSTDKGITWTNISSGLPALHINCIVYDRNSDEGLYIGNQAGVWYRDNSIGGWVHFSNGLPVVDVRELEIYQDVNPANSRLMAATYGRGLWSSDLYVTSVLPVTLSAFGARCEGAAVVLDWETQTERNNDYFAVERSSDGKVWQTVATVKGAGNATEQQVYQAKDHRPLSGVAYYRLRQTDFDGQTALSNVVSLSCEGLPAPEVKVYPNPTTGEVQIQGYGQAARLRVYNATGQLVHTLMPADDADALYIGFLPKGVYVFEFSSERMTELHRVVLR